MNDKKICFIYCINDRILFEESKKYVESLYVPESYEVEILNVEQAPSMTAGYNYAMEASDAKYKVYLHQDVFIINKEFLIQIVDMFNNNSDVGMLGMIGAKSLPANGIWWESQDLYGKVYDSHTGKMDLLTFQEVIGDFQEVEAADGLLLATQYDLPWREDLFDGWHFYDVSQCTEFIRNGYKVAIPKQESPWVLHDCGVPSVKDYYYYRSLFVNHYGWKDNETGHLPLVSILIPTYNRPELFELALKSALGQTYPNIEVIVCDDSSNDDTEKLIRKYLRQFDNLIYERNERNLGQFQNDIKLFDMASGEYINFLMDDDLFHPEKIMKMMKYYLADTKKEITLVTSHRLLIDDEGKYYPEIGIAKRLFEEDTIIDGIEFGDFVLGLNANFIGEPTTAMFRKSDLSVPFGTYFDREYGCRVDMATWLNLLAKGKIVYISETLSYFRLHGGQQQQSLRMEILGAADYSHELIHAPINGFFTDKGKYIKALQFCSKRNSEVMNKVEQSNEIFYLDELIELNRQIEQLLYGLIKIEEHDNQLHLPLVSVLIPAYNRPHYLELALKSVLAQTYHNIEIIICDDSTNDEVQKMIKKYLVGNTKIRYFKNDVNYNKENWQKCLDLSSGEYVNFLMDDDLFHPEKIEKMVSYFINDSEVSLVTSYRQLIDDEGNYLPDNDATKKLFNKDTKIDGKVLGNYVLTNCNNVIGEPTTVMFKKSELTEKFGVYKGQEYYVINDLASWIHLLAKGKAVYISEALSYFRQHSGQNQRKPDVLLPAIKQWLQVIIDSRQDGFLNEEIAFKKALTSHLRLSYGVIQVCPSFDNEQNFDAEESLHKSISLLFNHSDTYSCNFCNNSYQAFLPWPDKYDFPDYQYEMWNKQTAVCPSCHSIDRERLYKLFLSNHTDIENVKKKILHIAPEPKLREWLTKLNLEYICGDLYPQDKDTKKIDITEINYPDEMFDIIFCSHVLEHVPNDIKAMAELYRVMKRGGWGIIQVPIILNISETFEDPNVTSPEERLRIFGQEDHVRLYERNSYLKRLKSVGFIVQEYKVKDLCSKDQALKYGLSNEDVLYVVQKK